MIHVAYGLCDLDGHYSKFCGTSILSIFENTREQVTVHIIHDQTLTPDNRDKFIYLAGQYNQWIKFYDVDACAPERMRYLRQSLAERFGAFSLIGMFFRLLIPEIISPSLDKIIYLDAGDTIVNLDIKKLWNVELGDRPLAAASDYDRFQNVPQQRNLCDDGFVEPEKYFNSGVLIINLELWRANMDKIFGRGGGYDLWINNYRRYTFFDQDILNYCFAKDAVRLPDEFNCFVIFERMGENRSMIRQKLYHFAGFKPDLNIDDPFNRLWFEYFTKTPWFDVEMFKGLFHVFNQQYDRQKIELLNVSNLQARRRRSFFVEPHNVEALRGLFKVADDEPVFNASAPDALRLLANTMHNDGGRHVCFILHGNYNSIRQFLLTQNFVENLDFINAIIFLNSQMGVPLSSQNVLRMM